MLKKPNEKKLFRKSNAIISTVSFVLAISMLSSQALVARDSTKVAAEGETLSTTRFATVDQLATTWNTVEEGTKAEPGGSNQYIYWGEYPQEKEGVNGDFDELGTFYNAQGDTVYLYKLDEDKYAKYGNDTFKVTPIKWRILENKGGELYLFSDKVIDCGQYNKKNINGNPDLLPADYWWGTEEDGAVPDLRTWLTETFLGLAFRDEEKQHLVETSIRCLETGGNGGLDVMRSGNLSGQYVWLLGGIGGENFAPRTYDKSSMEAFNQAYGFSTYNDAKLAGSGAKPSRDLDFTDFAKAKENEETKPSWWLRDSGTGHDYGDGESVNHAMSVNDDDKNAQMRYFDDVRGVAPAIKLNTADIAFAAAGCAGQKGKVIKESILVNTPMYVHFKDTETNPYIYRNFENTEVFVEDATDEQYIVVQGENTTRSGGWVYTAPLRAGEVNKITVADVNAGWLDESIESFENVKVWVERHSGSLFLASEAKYGRELAIDQWMTSNGMNIRMVVENGGVIPSGYEIVADVVREDHGSFSTFKSLLDQEYRNANVILYDLYLRNIKTGERMEEAQTFTDNVVVYVQIPGEMNVDNVRPLYLTSGGDQVLEHWIEIINNVNYAVFRTNHFSPYALVEKQGTDEPGTGGSTTKTGDYTTICSMGFVILAAGALMVIARRRKIED